ncbi:MAG: nickel-type superoxide dismutase maturation protease [Acidimicrobiales bacterium]
MARAAWMRVAVEGDSMAPTLLPGDRLLAQRAAGLEVDDLVVVMDPRQQDRLLVKRVASINRAGVEVLGDNPGSSTDSRIFGIVPRELVIAVAKYRYAPAQRAGKL